MEVSTSPSAMSLAGMRDHGEVREADYGWDHGLRIFLGVARFDGLLWLRSSTGCGVHDVGGGADVGV